MIYTGVRPAEGRGLLWGDLVSFLDHPEDYLLNIEKYRQPDSTELVFFLKTDNGYRRIPVHPELLLFLKKRLEFVRSQCPGKDMSQMPICCIGNDFDIPCKDYEVAQKAAEIFKMIQMKEENLEVYRLLWELEPEIYDDGVAREQHLHLYVLRRFFLNWLIAHTLLDKLEKLYLMGHKMMVNNKNVRPQYNDENRLYEMYQMMSQCLINRELHEEQITIRFDGGTTPLIDNAGIRHLVIPEELRRTGGTLIISVTTEETDDAVYLDVSESIPLDVSGAKVTAMTQKKNPGRVNCEWENWSAHKDPEQSAPEDDISKEDLSTK